MVDTASQTPVREGSAERLSRMVQIPTVSAELAERGAIAVRKTLKHAQEQLGGAVSADGTALPGGSDAVLTGEGAPGTAAAPTSATATVAAESAAAEPAAAEPVAAAAVGSGAEGVGERS